MTRILVSGLINIETTVRVEGFPIAYTPARYPFGGVNSTVSGVGYNVTKALVTLGDEVSFLSLIGRDAAGELVQAALRHDGLPSGDVLATLARTPQSAILYDGDGRRQINVDLKDIQEQGYPAEEFARALSGCEAAALCNINFSRPMLAHARRAGKLVATDVHAIADLDDAYNADFMRAADVLFLSDENLRVPPEEWARTAQSRYGNEVIVIGLGAAGALLCVKRAGYMARFPAMSTRPVINTIGAGDALFSCFIHYYARTRDPQAALRRAMVFASWKVGATGAAEGFLTPEELERLVAQC